jgi:5-methylcytosine-specific restriction endonuclease McrA
LDDEARWHQAQLFEVPPGKRCSRCGEVKPLDEFHKNRSNRDGLQARCRECNTSVAKQHYADHPEHRRARIDAWMRRVNDEHKRRVLEHLRDHPCVDCGEDDPVVLEFDHLRDKSSGVSELLLAHVRWERVAAEIAKCEVRCANCHRRRTAALGGWFRYRES